MTRAAEAGMTPSEFWELTPFELGVVLRAYYRRTRHQARLMMSAARVIISPWCGKRTPSLNRLMGGSSFGSSDELKAHMREKANRFGSGK